MTQANIVRLYETGKVTDQWAAEMLHRLTRAPRAECLLFISHLHHGSRSQYMPHPAYN